MPSYARQTSCDHLTHAGPQPPFVILWTVLCLPVFRDGLSAANRCGPGNTGLFYDEAVVTNPAPDTCKKSCACSPIQLVTIFIKKLIINREVIIDAGMDLSRGKLPERFPEEPPPQPAYMAHPNRGPEAPRHFNTKGRSETAASAVTHPGSSRRSPGGSTCAGPSGGAGCRSSREAGRNLPA